MTPDEGKEEDPGNAFLRDALQGWPEIYVRQCRAAIDRLQTEPLPAPLPPDAVLMIFLEENESEMFLMRRAECIEKAEEFEADSDLIECVRNPPDPALLTVVITSPLGQAVIGLAYKFQEFPGTTPIH